MGAQLLAEILPDWLAGKIQIQPQDDAQATYCSPLEKQDGHLDWIRPASYLDRQVRACDPWPGAYTTWQGRRLKVLRAHPSVDGQKEGVPGTVIELGAGMGVITGDGVLELSEVQLAGKRPMVAGAFARGQRDLIGSILGT